MSPCAARTVQSRYNFRKLIGQYHAQRIPVDKFSSMSECCAVTFRPGGYTHSFAGKTILPAGIATMFVLSYDVANDATGKRRLHIPLTAYKAEVRPDGTVVYGLETCRLSMDLSRKPRLGAKGQVIDPQRNPSLLEVGLRIDKACQRAVANAWRLPEYATLPRVLLAFPPDRLPPFQDTPALRRLVANQLGVSLESLGRNGEVLLNRLLKDAWEQSILWPTDPRNRTGGAVLIDAQLCPNARGFLRAYEDFTHLLGVPTWNPSRKVRVRRFENPALQVLTQVGFGPNPDFNQPIGEQTIAAMVQAMRQAIGDNQAAFTDEDLLDGITSADSELVPWSTELPPLRAALPVWAQECSTDEDIKQATREVEQPLWVRYACRIQVLRRVRPACEVKEGRSANTNRLSSASIDLQLAG